MVRTFGWLVILGPQRRHRRTARPARDIDWPPELLYTEFAVVLGLTQLFMPLTILSSYSAVAQVDPGLEDAARGPRREPEPHLLADRACRSPCPA